MATEIERKFLVANDKWRRRVEKTHVIRQGYLETQGDATVRIRVVADPDLRRTYAAALTIKGPTKGLVRAEYEYPICLKDAKEMLDLLCGTRLVEKLRHIVPCRKSGGDIFWEIDEFTGRHAGLILAEIELRQSNQKISLPKWVGREVSGNPQFSNHSLAIHGMRLMKKEKGRDA